VEIRKFQDMMRQIYLHKDLRRGVEGTYNRLLEELWELQEALNTQDKRALENEFADVIAWLASLANITEVVLEDAVLGKYNHGCPKCNNSPCQCEVEQ
jgi:NTP pyrophosphatase (non-canonical NTP hydrolase)